jgi:hypothetical protein
MGLKNGSKNALELQNNFQEKTICKYLK